MSTRTLILLLAMLAIPGAGTGMAHDASDRGGTLRFPTIEAKYDAIVLVADAHSGRLLGGVRTAQASTVRYHPASLFKLPIALAALGSGRFASTFSYTCTGSDTIGGQPFQCWRKDGHGRLDFRGAIAHSCNLYFRTIAEQLPRSQILQAARLLGMIPTNGQSLVMEPGKASGLSDDNLLGEAYTLSPMELLGTATMLASRGRLAHRPLLENRYRPLFDGLQLCVTEGTGMEGCSRRFTMAGKTGTAAMPEAMNATVGWFIGYAPATSPRYAVCVLMKHAHGSDAARVARETLEELL